MIIKRNDFNNLHFTQTGNSCVLASYGVCAYPFIHKNIEEFFQGYCEHFGLGNINKTHEKQYDDHFHSYCHINRVSGYSLIKCLHDTSQIQIFKDCRENFRLIKLMNNRFEKLKEKVEDGKRALMMQFVHECCNLKVMHSVAVGFDEVGYFMFDTNPQQGLLTLNKDCFKNNCNLGETFLIEGI